MFAARNLQKHCLKTLSSLLQSNPNRNVVAFKDTAPKLISSNVIRLDGCFEDNFASFPSFTDPFNGWFRMMSTSRGRSMRSKVERRMQKESGNASSIEEPCKIRVKYGRQYNRHRLQWCSKLGGFFCTCLVKEDCCKVEDLLQQQSGEEDALFCTLCNAEWLNNCVGRKNYISFVCLMAASLVRFGVGIAVIVRCFNDRKGTKSEITEKLGVGFSRPPFATVVRPCLEPPYSLGDQDYSVPSLHVPWPGTPMPYNPFLYQHQADANRFHLTHPHTLATEYFPTSMGASKVASMKNSHINRNLTSLQINHDMSTQFDAWGLCAESPLASTLTEDDFLEMVMIPSPTVQESTSGKHRDDSNSSLVTDMRHSLLLCNLNSNLETKIMLLLESVGSLEELSKICISTGNFMRQCKCLRD